MVPETWSQVVVVPDTFRHSAAKVMVSWPVVMVWSVKVPLALAIQLPLTWMDPVSAALTHPRLIPSMFLSPETVRQEGVTFQLPTTLPPQGVTLAPLLQEPPVLGEPPLEPPAWPIWPTWPAWPVWPDAPPLGESELVVLLEHEAPKRAQAAASVANRCSDFMRDPDRKMLRRPNR